MDFDKKIFELDKEDIWVLGRDDVIAGNYIPWNYNNLCRFVDCKCLVVDMTTLDHNTLSKISESSRENLRDAIRTKLNNGIMIICILPPFEHKTCSLAEDMLFWLPIKFLVNSTDPAKTRYNNDFLLYEYTNRLKNWSMIIKPKPYGSMPMYDHRIRIHSAVKSNHQENIAVEFKLPGKSYAAGSIFVLPPLLDHENSCNVVLKLFKKLKQSDNIPNWVKNLEIHTSGKLKMQIKDEEKLFNEKLKKLNNELNELEKWKKLLFIDGLKLQHIVQQALTFLEFQNVQSGGEGMEDIMFDITTNKHYVVKVEVKGSLNNIKKNDVIQILEWKTSDQKNNVKPVLVVNIFRHKEYPKYIDKRIQFDDYKDTCERCQICVIPTVFLFELVKNKLEGKTIDTKILSELIISSNGVIKNWESAIL